MKLLVRIFILLSLACGINLSHAATDVQFSQAELDQMLAPVALYPDTILSQVLIAATYPIEVVQADRWAKNNPNMKGADAVKMVDGKDWDPSVKSLVAFPDILARMSDDIDWTQRLGDAFLSDEQRVMDSIQQLRKRAYSSGTLGKVEHLRVQRDDDEIIIEPAEERVVYVPVYDTRVVYGNWWWADYPPVYWHYPSSYVFVSGFYWGSSVFIGPTFFYSSCHWHERRVVVVDRFDDRHPHPVFYSSRSIIRFEGAHDWHHDPVHRRGVAYYNNNLRDDYGSRHESREDARIYREDHRNGRRDDDRDHYRASPRQTRFDDEHPGNSRAPQRSGVNFGMPSNGNLNPSTPGNLNPPVGHAVQSRDIKNEQETRQDDDRNDDRSNSRPAEQVDGRFIHYNDSNKGDSNNTRIIHRSHNDENRTQETTPNVTREAPPSNYIPSQPQGNPYNPYSSRTSPHDQQSTGEMSLPQINRRSTDSTPAPSAAPVPDRVIHQDDRHSRHQRVESNSGGDNSNDDKPRGRVIR